MTGNTFYESVESQALLQKETTLSSESDTHIPSKNSRTLLIQHFIEAQATCRPHALAVVMGDVSLTYGMLNTCAARLAHHLQERGVGPEKTVGFCMQRSPEMIIGLLAILKAGGVVVPLDAGLPEQRLAFILQETAAVLVLTQHCLLQKLTTLAVPSLCLDGEWPDSEGSSTQASLQGTPVQPANLAFIIYTSGSTGSPKGVMISHAALAHRIQSFEQIFRLGPEDRQYQYMSLSFDAAGEEVYPALCNGATLVLAEATAAEGVLEIWHDARHMGLTKIDLPAAVWQQVVDETIRDPHSFPGTLNTLAVGGEALSPDTLRLWGEHLPQPLRFFNMYGPTEATIAATYFEILLGKSLVPQAIPIGRAFADTCLFVLDQDFQPVQEGLPGELFIGGPGVSRGYVQQPDLTAERFPPDPFSTEPGARLYRTGDLVRFISHDELEFLGRIDDQVKIRGFRIEPGEIEAILRQHPAVAGVMVLPWEAPPTEVCLVAYIVQTPDELVTSNAQHAQQQADSHLRTYLADRLPSYMIPAAFVVLKAFPLTANGKIDRRLLPPPMWEHNEAGTPPSAPRTQLEEILVDIWSQVLGVSRVGIQDDFFELGGHSLLATRAISQIRETLNVVLSFRTFFEHRSVAELAAYIEQHFSPSRSSALSPMRGGTYDEISLLSFAQQRLWFLDQLEPNNPFYTIAVAIHLEGPLQVRILERSFSEIIRRHEVLRTAFAAPQGKPVQVIASPAPLNITHIDLRHLLPGTTQLAAITQLEAEESQQPFDLRQSPLLRVKLLRLSAVKHILLLSMHHIVSDDWSMEVFFHELSVLYEAFVHGESSPLPLLPIQYVDYALWQRKWLQGSILEKELSYWRRQLSDLPLLQLPTDHPYPPTPTHRGATWSFVVPPDITREIRKLCQEEKATLFMLLLAAYQVLLSRHSGQDDIVVGSPIANRMQSEVEALIGFFANTLVFRARLADTLPFRAFLRQVRHIALEAYAHQEVPFEQIVEELQPERNLMRHPLFQTAFALLNDPVLTLNISDLTLRLLDIDNGTAKFDLTLFMRDEKEQLVGKFEYNANIFEAATIGRLSIHFCALLKGIVSLPECPLIDLPLLTAPEREQVLITWNATQTPYPVHRCVHELFEDQVTRSPDAIAVAYDDAQLTFYELNRRANQLAHGLQKLQVGPEVVVGVCLDRSPELIIALLGILKAGGVYMPFDLAYPRERLAFIARDAQVPVVLTQQALLHTLPEHQWQTISLDADWTWLARESGANPQSGTTAENLAYVIYTSGSTGEPKGVAVPHKAINRLVCHTDYVQLDCDDHIAQASTASFDAATFEVWGALLNGGRLVGVTKEIALDPQAFARILRVQSITVLFLTTALFKQSIQEIPYIFQSLHTLLFGGEAVDPRWVREALKHGAPERLLHVYGPTENTTFSSWYLVQAVPDDAETVPIGRPIANSQFYVLDQRLQPVPVGVRGELYVGGAGLASGYLKRPALTAAHFVPHPFSTEPGARLYKTGDIVRQLANGNIEFLGRVDHQVKLRGFRIELGEIEATLNQHPAVQEAVLVVREDIPGDKRLVAYVVPRPEKAEGQQDSEEASANEHITTWQGLFDDIYASSNEEENAEFNIVGWNSSYVDEPIPAEHMQEWLEQTLMELREETMQRVLEIGCGTGLLLLRLAPISTKYWGTDFSAAALQMVQRHVQKKGLSQVQLLQRLADDFTGMEEQTFDTILLNSVVQYFPSLNYLLQVIEGALQKIVLGGNIFIGDIRNFQLLEIFHTSIELHRCSDAFPLAQFRPRVRAQMAQESELLLDPAFFYALQKRYPQIREVCIRPKRGRYDNELTAFRYSVRLKIGDGPAVAASTEVHWLDWQHSGLSLEALRQHLLAQQPYLLTLTHVPNAHLSTEIEALKCITSQERQMATMGEVRAALNSRTSIDGVTPEELHLLGQELGYMVSVRWSGIEADGSFDVAFWRPEASMQARKLSWPAPVHIKPWSQYANQPLREKLKSTSKLTPQLRSYLQERLSDYMIPSSFVLLDVLPLNTNGKVDRQALPLPGQARPLQHIEYLAPRNPVEEIVSGIWVDILGIEQIGVQDNFFEIGGHSLLATQVISRICDIFQMDLPLRTLFEASTVESLARALVFYEAQPGQTAAMARLHMKLNRMSADEIEHVLQRKKEI
ncbi:MAG: amino acid adenylation domain-containing protein [Ktedonobacteraceae bacterium]|nr:amino acid adenylation domain-containing protein [Ktedonobacteraceae bacterium]